ncbi:MAG: GNAT family N-acetyltransferase [Tabrizicola sp.]|jgi:RimJ/RimL family protein N-acetyltransferase|nr:GNAT family N-acetyltransferase [Tabrizicola sp.]
MLRPARVDEAGLIERLWNAPANAMWIEPPEDGEIDEVVAQGDAYVWDLDGTVTGFATLITWVPQVYGLGALAVTQRGQGEPFLRALLAEVFGPRGGHRIGFDVTADNSRALRLYERLGFQREGLIRECWLRPDGRWVDCLMLGLLQREWQP